jgi:hypothetical protein
MVQRTVVAGLQSINVILYPNAGAPRSLAQRTPSAPKTNDPASMSTWFWRRPSSVAENFRTSFFLAFNLAARRLTSAYGNC